MPTYKVNFKHIKHTSLCEKNQKLWVGKKQTSSENVTPGKKKK
jgi:hypothetical protein